MKISVDYDLCSSNAVCMGIAPERTTGPIRAVTHWLLPRGFGA